MRRFGALAGTTLAALALGACGASTSSSPTTTITPVTASSSTTSTTATPTTTTSPSTTSTTTTSTTVAQATTTTGVRIEGEDAYLAALLVPVPGYEYVDLPDDLRRMLEETMNQELTALQGDSGINPVERVSGHLVTEKGAPIGILMLLEWTDDWKAFSASMLSSFVQGFGMDPDVTTSTMDVDGVTVIVATGTSEAEYAWFNAGVLHVVVGDSAGALAPFVEGFIRATATQPTDTTAAPASP